MNKHVDKAMKLRNETPMVNNCAQTVMRTYAEELGMSEELAAKHDGMINCADLLRANAKKGGSKKAHCDGLICEAIELIDKLAD